MRIYWLEGSTRRKTSPGQPLAYHDGWERCQLARAGCSSGYSYAYCPHSITLFFFPARAGNYHPPSELHSCFMMAGSQLVLSICGYCWSVYLFFLRPMFLCLKENMRSCKGGCEYFKSRGCPYSRLLNSCTSAHRRWLVWGKQRGLVEWQGRRWCLRTAWCHAALTHPTSTGWSPQPSFRCPFTAGKAQCCISPGISL